MPNIRREFSLEVPQGRWKSIVQAGQIYTQGVETCIAVSIYSEKDRLAYLGHFISIHATDRRGGLSNMVRAAKEKISHIEESRVWLGGGLLINPDIPAEREPFPRQTAELANEQTLEFRSRIFEGIMFPLFAEHGAEVHAQWLNQPAHLDYRLDTSSGDEVVQIYPRYTNA